MAGIVDGVTKLDRLQFDSKEAQQAATIRKMLVAMANDWRVLLIKLADRLHNMRTLAVMPEWKQRRTAQETFDIYAPLAHRLGIQQVQVAARGPGLRHPAPQALRRDRADGGQPGPAARRVPGPGAGGTCASGSPPSGVAAEVTGRPKHLWSIYEKMVVRGKEFDDINDLVGIRVIVESEKDCWAALGSIHAIWPPVQGRFKDYINTPKFNLYQSLHTTVIGLDGKPIEVQIRTHEMHRRAEYGIAAHWGYKENASPGPRARANARLQGEQGGQAQQGGGRARRRGRPAGAGVPKPEGRQGQQHQAGPRGGSPTPNGRRSAERDRRAERLALAKETSSTTSEIAWLQRIVDVQNETTDPIEFLEALKLDLEQDEVYVFTPKGKVIALPANATPGRLRLRHPHRGRAPLHRGQGQRPPGPARHPAAARPTPSRSSPPRRPTAGPVAGLAADRRLVAGPQQDPPVVLPGAARGRHRERPRGADQGAAAGRPAVQKLAVRHALADVAAAMNYADLDALYAAIGENQVSAQSVAQRLPRDLRGGVYEEQLPTTARAAADRPPARAAARRSASTSRVSTT